ncbi:hypothetical protein [Nocardioides sp.]|uniref:hypothetical protein n=1 Tax=Nocardioides sp. TaxID=35761 RepID=UPI0027284BC4|nr:hypothetical protein [Nocardioides sp.]MDO9456736.1 hypothetical protein [Nocardioides sp.]
MSARAHGLVAAAVSLVVLLLAGLALAGGASADETPTPDPTTSPTSPTQTTTTEPTEPTGPVALDDAVLAWGLNNESNNKAFAPGTYNFLSAGAVPDPGKGGQNIVTPGVWRGTTTKAWRARAGEVELQKRRADGTWAGASFAGLSTAADGTPLTSTTGPFSGHRVVLTGGTGTVDAAAGTATISWTGTFSVVYYSGFTFFTVTNPSLVVADGVGRLSATLAGYAADRDDPDKWSAVPAQRVVVADLPAVDLSGDDGFSAQPAYLGVRGGEGQVREGSSWGAFPATFLAYMDRVGSSAFWYSSGGSADSHKVPTPVTITFDADRAVPDPTDPTSEPTDDETDPTDPSASPTTTVGPTPPTPTVPAAPVAPTLPAVTQLPGPSIPPQPGAVPSAAPVAAAVAVPQPVVPPTVYALAAETSEAGTAGSGPSWTWWLGGLLLVGAAGLTLLTVRSGRALPKGTSRSAASSPPRSPPCSSLPPPPSS